MSENEPQKNTLSPADATPYADILCGVQSNQEATGCGIKPACAPPRDGETAEQIRERGLQAAQSARNHALAIHPE